MYVCMYVYISHYSHTAVKLALQSEEEAALGIPETIHMDRRHPEKLPAIQLSFIQNLVSPLFQACAEAGIIPGILEAGSDKDGASRTASPTDKGEDVKVMGGACGEAVEVYYT